MSVPRPEYPRPQFVRREWMNLNGEWEFSFDGPTFDRRIVVPYAFQSKMSGVGAAERHDMVWYRRDFLLPPSWRGKTVYLHFGAVDYFCRVWINDCYVGRHTGGHVRFSLDITHALWSGENTVMVQVEDVRSDREMPRGKQYWKDQPAGIFYTPTTGIWQTVWLEPVEKDHLLRIDMTPELDDRAAVFHAAASRGGVELEIDVDFQGEPVARERLALPGGRGRVGVPLDGDWQGTAEEFIARRAWSPETPWLFDVTLRLLRDGRVTDTVTSYFGLRKISVEDGRICLNGRPYYQKLLLDQGYWPESLLTAPTDEAFITDIRYCKAMGFNGVRKHQKAEDPRFLYHADRLGLLVWGEMANAFDYSRRYVGRFTAEWMEILARDYNHPCIVAWTPINESWGVGDLAGDPRQIHHLSAMVELTRSLDATRLVMSNDGWEQTNTDVLGIHDYEADPAVLTERYGSLESVLESRPSDRDLFARGFGYAGQPVMVTECGGIALRSGETGWGYTSTASGAEFLEAYRGVVSALLASPVVQGFCYTQLTDVQQERNGLLTFTREPKVDCAAIRRINEGLGPEET